MDETRKELLRIVGYSEKSIGLIDSETNIGEMEHPTVRVRHAGSCNDVLMLFLNIERDIIEDASFEYIGCAGLQASASGVTEMIKGMSVVDAENVSIQTIAEYLEGLAKDKSDCIEIAHATLHKALEEYREQQAG